jgi:2-keto-3-deoxy-L-rhamnonate aldolase RhmA
MKMNIVKDMLKAGKTVVGASASLNSPVEFLADAGFDFLLFDTQHYALDIGAKGIIVPMVNSKEEAAHMIRCCKYPTEGIRSAAGMRGEWGEFEDYTEYMSAVNEQVLTIPMIETSKALKNLDEILSVPGIDVLLVGPSDLSIALGIALDYHNPKYQETLDKIAEACSDAGVIPGMYFIPGGQDPSDFVERGFKFFTRPWSHWATTGIEKGLATIKR